MTHGWFDIPNLAECYNYRSIYAWSILAFWLRLLFVQECGTCQRYHDLSNTFNWHTRGIIMLHVSKMYISILTSSRKWSYLNTIRTQTSFAFLLSLHVTVTKIHMTLLHIWKNEMCMFAAMWYECVTAQVSSPLDLAMELATKKKKKEKPPDL